MAWSEYSTGNTTSALPDMCTVCQGMSVVPGKLAQLNFNFLNNFITCHCQVLGISKGISCHILKLACLSLVVYAEVGYTIQLLLATNKNAWFLVHRLYIKPIIWLLDRFRLATNISCHWSCMLSCMTANPWILRIPTVEMSCQKLPSEEHIQAWWMVIMNAVYEYNLCVFFCVLSKDSFKKNKNIIRTKDK